MMVGRVGVAADQGRHDRGVDHPQALEPLHPAARRRPPPSGRPPRPSGRCRPGGRSSRRSGAIQASIWASVCTSAARRVLGAAIGVERRLRGHLARRSSRPRAGRGGLPRSAGSWRRWPDRRTDRPSAGPPCRGSPGRSWQTWKVKPSFSTCHLAVVLHDRQHGVDLQVGPVQVGPRPQEGAALQELLAAQALARSSR